MKHSTAIILMVACSLIFGVLGAAGGAEYVLRGMDKINDSADAARATQDARDSIAQHAIVAELSQRAQTCEMNFSSSTLIYESAPQLNIAVTGLRTLPLIPVGVQGQPAPRWWIPARITPQTYGDPRGAVYFFTKRDPHATDGRLITEGPYAVQQVAQ